MNIKAICTDIDGTLLDKNRQLSPRTIAVIREVGQRIPVILASSRMPAAMTHLQEELGIVGHPLICYNGGYVLYSKGDQQEVINNVDIAVPIVRTIFSYVKDAELHVSLYHADNWFAPQHDYWTNREETITKAKATIRDGESVMKVWSSTGNGAHKVMCMGPESAMDAMERSLVETLNGDIHVYRSRPTYIEIAPKIISKGSALSSLMQAKFQISPSEIMAFGDNYNDIEMLKVAGKGVAVSNAKAEVIAVADEVTLASTEDGVAIAIEKYCF